MEDQLAAPPILARLVLRLTTPRHLYFEVAADLAEEFAARPSNDWYWRQVLSSTRFWFAASAHFALLLVLLCIVLPISLLDLGWAYCASSVPLKMPATHPPVFLRFALLLPPILALAAPKKEST